MKKTAKTLSLHLETLRHLRDPEIVEVAGGGANTADPRVSLCVCATKPGRCVDQPTDLCTLE